MNLITHNSLKSRYSDKWIPPIKFYLQKIKWEIFRVLMVLFNLLIWQKKQSLCEPDKPYNSMRVIRYMYVATGFHPLVLLQINTKSNSSFEYWIDATWLLEQ